MFSENIHHIIISKYTLKCTQLNYFSDEHIPSNPLAIKLNSVIRTVGSTTQGDVLQKLHPPPLFGHRFLPSKNDHSFRHSPPPGNDRVCDHNAMSAFPQEKNSHYTTGYEAHIL